MKKIQNLKLKNHENIFKIKIRKFYLNTKIRNNKTSKLRITLRFPSFLQTQEPHYTNLGGSMTNPELGDWKQEELSLTALKMRWHSRASNPVTPQRTLEGNLPSFLQLPVQPAVLT